MKKLVLLLVLVMLLSGCGMSKGEERKAGPEPESEPGVLIWTIAGVMGFESEDSIPEEKIAECNQLLAEKGKDCQIRFQFVTFPEGQITEEAEKLLRQSDLITIANSYTWEDDVQFYRTVRECAENGLFEPLDAHLDTENGRKIKERMLTELTLDNGCREGTQWVLPTEPPMMVGSSLRMKGGLYERSGLGEDPIPDFTKCDAVFEKLYLANGKKPFLVFSDRKTVCGFNGIPVEMPSYLTEMLSANGSIWKADVLGVGSLISAGNDRDLRNLLKEPYLEAYLNAWRRYTEKGYVTEDMDAEVVVEIADSYRPEVVTDSEGEKLVTPKSGQYVLYRGQNFYGLAPFNAIGAESGEKELAFEILTTMITDKELSDMIRSVGGDGPSGFVFRTGLSEAGEQEYQRLVQTIPQFTRESSFDTFSVPEIEALNRVYAEYSTEYGDESGQQVLERHFSEEGKVTEESIRAGIRRLNEKLDAAGMETFIEAFRKHRKQ